MALGFGSTSGVGSTDAVGVGYNFIFAPLSVFVWFRSGSSGGGTNGRIYQQLSASSGHYLAFDGGTNNVQFIHKFSTTDLTARDTTAITNNLWHSFGLSYDSSSVSNTPITYYDGAKHTVGGGTVVIDTTPVGTAGITPTAQVTIANNAPTGGIRNWDGVLAHLAFWSAILSDAEFQALAHGVLPSAIRPFSLRNYEALDGYTFAPLELTRKTIGVVSPMTLTGTALRPSPPLVSAAPVFPGVPMPFQFTPPVFVLMPQILW
jgi:hypothetical protein